MNKNINVPNALSVFRILLIAPFAVLYLNGQIIWAVVLLVLSGLSDMVDGYIARRFNQVTELGKMLDPVADKLTQATIVICLAIVNPVLIPLLAVFLIKEILMLLGGAFLLKKGKRPCAAKWYGKVATILFYLTFTVIVILRAFWPGYTGEDWITISMLVITAGMMVFALVRYFFVFLQILRSNPEETLPKGQEAPAGKKQ